MKYTAVINAFAGDWLRQAGAAALFLEKNALGTDGGRLVICMAKTASESGKTPDTGMFDDIWKKLLPVSEVVFFLAEDYQPEDTLSFLESLPSGTGLWLFPGNRFGEELAVRLAARLGGSSLGDVLSASVEKDTAGERNVLSAERKLYSGHIRGIFEMRREPYVLSLSAELPWEEGGKTFSVRPEIQTVESCGELPPVSRYPAEKAGGLQDAKYVAVAGMGTGSRKNAEEAASLAAGTGMESGGSRPCVMHGWMPMNRMIGVSGVSVRPKICILLGVSGAPAFYSGVKNSEHIIAINCDENAPVMKKADLAVLGDCMEIFRRFIMEIQNG